MGKPRAIRPGARTSRAPRPAAGRTQQAGREATAGAPPAWHTKEGRRAHLRRGCELAAARTSPDGCPWDVRLWPIRCHGTTPLRLPASRAARRPRPIESPIVFLGVSQVVNPCNVSTASRWGECSHFHVKRRAAPKNMSTGRTLWTAMAYRFQSVRLLGEFRPLPGRFPISRCHHRGAHGAPCVGAPWARW